MELGLIGSPQQVRAFLQGKIRHNRGKGGEGMLRVKLQRMAGGDQGTPGHILFPSGWGCLSLELPDRGNTPGKSRILSGIYTVGWGWSSHMKGYRWHVMDTPGRVGVLIHAGNRAGDIEKGWKSDVLGCILVGKVFGKLQGQLAILQSQKALDEFTSHLLGETRFELEILDHADSTD